MKKHTEIYLKAFGYGITDFIPSEISGQRAVDVNHIDCRGAGGSDDKDYIENLMAVTRKEHNEFGDKKHYRNLLVDRHIEFMQQNGVKFDMKKALALKY